MIAEWQTAVARVDIDDLITVSGYLIAAAMAAKASSAAWVRREEAERLFWRCAALLLVFLGINEVLDLQALLTAAGRHYAKEDGWYEQRREMQYAFVLALAAITTISGLAVVWFVRRMHVSVWITLAGLCLLGLFVLSRAASIHHFDEWIGRGTPQFNYGSVVEMAGILIVAAGALLYGRARRVRPRQRLRP